jgi:hypothetical protein
MNFRTLILAATPVAGFFLLPMILEDQHSICDAAASKLARTGDLKTIMALWIGGLKGNLSGPPVLTCAEAYWGLIWAEPKTETAKTPEPAAPVADDTPPSGPRPWPSHTGN